MSTNVKSIAYVILGMVLSGVIFYSLNKCSGLGTKNEQNDYYILTNQITKMNKMVVMEQEFTSILKSDVSVEFLGNKISNNQIMTFTRTNAQVSYDLNKMKIEVDSVNKKLIIVELPNPEIRVTPNVEIKSMDDSFFNRIDEAQIKKVTNASKEHALKQIDQEMLKKEGKEQLKENLNQIFVLAKALNYSIEDKSNTLVNILN